MGQTKFTWPDQIATILVTINFMYPILNSSLDLKLDVCMFKMVPILYYSSSRRRKYNGFYQENISIIIMVVPFLLH